MVLDSFNTYFDFTHLKKKKKKSNAQLGQNGALNLPDVACSPAIPYKHQIYANHNLCVRSGISRTGDCILGKAEVAARCQILEAGLPDMGLQLQVFPKMLRDATPRPQCSSEIDFILLSFLPNTKQ